MKAVTDYPIDDLIANRWSPYSFANRPVSDDDLRSLFEAVRWAPSSFNEQPWSYIVAKKEDAAEFERLLSCLVEVNQAWAKDASALAFSVSRLNFTKNNQTNGAAIHDIGLASANLVLEATARGLVAHQMIGILPDKVRELFSVPEGYQPLTAIAIGYPGDPANLPEGLRVRDAARRPRKPLKDFVFGGRWGVTSSSV
jgi:nitroreductase